MLVTDAVCVKVLAENQIIVGIGNQLHYFYQENDETIRKVCPVKTRDKIEELKFFKNDDHEDQFQIMGMAGYLLLFTKIQQHDFQNTFTLKINDWITDIQFTTTANRIFLVTAHNRACEISLNYESAKGSAIQKARCDDFSTAYSSLIHGLYWDELLFFAGTAFGELILWRPKKDNILGETILHVEGAHNGVIFNIRYNLKENFLVTTSDDRSIQLWKLSNIIKNEKYSIEKIKKCFGHTARVFRSQIIYHQNDVYFISIGEDSKVCLWDTTGNLVYSKVLNTGATLWGLDYCQASKTAFVTAGNGQIIQIPIDFMNSKTNLTTKKTDVIEKWSQLPIEEHIVKLKFLVKAGLLITLTNKNRLFYKKYNEITCKEILLPPEKSFCVLQTHGMYVYLATTHSEVFTFEYMPELSSLVLKQENQINWTERLEDKSKTLIRALIPINKIFLMASSNKGELLIVDSVSFIEEKRLSLPKCSEPWITSAIKFDETFLVGDRCGHLHLYRGQSNALHTLKRLHGNLGVTLIEQINPKTFITAGHDGCYKTIVVEDDHLRHIFTCRVPINWIERRLGEYTFGFNDAHFVCHSDVDGVVHEQNCGGGHRRWDLHLNEKENTISVAFIRHRGVVVSKFKLRSKEKQINFDNIQWHHNSCNVIEVITMNGIPILVSGGEDTLLKFYDIESDSDNIRLKPIRTSYQHISSIKSFTYLQASENQVIFISVGGRAQICITRITVNPFLLEEELNYMLFQSDTIRKREGNAQNVLHDPETRLTSICTVIDKSKTYVICACSDGFLRIFELFLERKPVEIIPFKEINYGKCLLHVKSMKSTCNQHLIITTSTDGLINFWDFDNMSVPLSTLRHHNSGIHAWDIFTTESLLHIVTGGDDQSIVYSKIMITLDGKITVEKTIFIKNLHTAQVTGVKFQDNAQAILCTGVDQMVYRINIDQFNGYQIQKSIWTSIADVKGLLIYDDYTIVYGNGIEIIKI